MAVIRLCVPFTYTNNGKRRFSFGAVQALQADKQEQYRLSFDS